ncbi:MAG: transporter substrate-binding domain-containing protein [Ruminiclostridium sp.]
MKFRKTIAAFVAAASLLTVAGCGGNNAPAAEAADIGSATKGKLTIGAEIGYPPFEYFDTDGVTPIGVDVELGKAIGEKLGVEVELINTGWDGIFSGLDKGDYDCIISAVTITPERTVNYDFSTPYIQNFQCLVSLKDSDFKPASLAEIAGKRVGYQEETTSDFYITDYADKNGITFEPLEYAKVIDVFSDLENGRLDAIICDSTVAQSYLGEGTIYEQTWIQGADETPEEFGVCIKKGNTKLVESINKALAEIKESGELDKILARYF